MLASTMDSTARSLPVPRVLVVEDEPDIAALIAYQLTREGFRVETAGSGTEALDAIAREIPDLVILDRMLPGLSGDKVLMRLRGDSQTARLPVLILTAKRDQEERIEGLELGADDYLAKPFSPKELVLRARAILRRAHDAGARSEGKVLRAGPLRVDVGSNETTLEGVELNLTPTEFRLLLALMERRGATQSRQQLLEKAWDVESGVSGRIQTRTVDMHVRRLRAKLGDVGAWIQTIRGFGYRLKVPEGRD
ncbi:MAG: response regulator transcription factor [Gemmatimonadota bacterium]|nr:response regulator transcription factor [Gemmatimonadota bacterium]